MKNTTNSYAAATCAVDYSRELARLLEAVSRIVEDSNERGFRPSFIVRSGAVVSVSAYPLKTNASETEGGAA